VGTGVPGRVGQLTSGMDQLFYGPDGTPLSKPEDVIRFLGRGEKHWNRERSAYQAAYSWFPANGLPGAIQEILKSDPSFDNVSVDKILFEKNTKLDAYGRDSQTDVVAILKTNSGPAVLGVEAKVDETFGPRVHEWNDYTPGKLRRLVGLLDRLGVKSGRIGSLRYQLFHRTAAALIEAEQNSAPNAAMLVQSFDKGHAGFADFKDFAEAFGTPVTQPGELSQPKKIGDVAIRLGWTENPMFVAKA
jgi:hypothetical protein